MFALLGLSACGVPASQAEDGARAARPIAVSTTAPPAPVASRGPTPAAEPSPPPRDPSIEPPARFTVTPDIYQEYGNAALIQALREQLRRSDLPSDTRRRIEARLAYQEHQAEAFATARARPTAPRPGGPAFTPLASPFPSPTSGIFQFPGGTTPSFLYRRYVIENAWRALEQGGHVIVYAGAKASDPTQGGVYVQVVFPNDRPETWYATPTRSGSVRILAEQNGQLTLEAETGDLFVFDVATRQFVDDPPAPTPTGDPNATPTATEGAE